MNRELLDEYKEKYPLYQEITEKTKQKLHRLLQQKNFHLHQIKSRVKTSASLANKLLQKTPPKHRLSDITDICGVRIITYYADEIDDIAACIRDNFAIDEENCVDKRYLLAPNAFGYLSLHIILEIPCTPDSPLPCCKVEVQIRTILQHAWAAIEHELEYKNVKAQSNELRRSFSRLASVLEVVDLEFIKIRNLVRHEKTTNAMDHSVPIGLLKHKKSIAPASPQKKFWQIPAYSSRGISYTLLVSALIAAVTSLYCGSQAAALVAQLTILLKNV